ncbi:pyridoxamine 5'-phosphate oxidase family protein [Helicovermis profundi]|uniref:Pyridoxamine 5'-phosphate oxidase family protein n=1 Tax=Helicovermis profundi TaxID=3065157 RepID=A0AAU9E5E8_9FIRM|nr:pyridoxamine 5'-phosphate oxidase family protein [Clostridia bacterium S502]
MFREMRRKDKILNKKECERLLFEGEYGVLSTNTAIEYPYVVPLNYVYHDNSIFFHCASEGYKLDNIELNNKVSFCVTSNIEILPNQFDTNYESVVIFGKAYEETEKKIEALKFLIEKYSNEFKDSATKYIEKAQSITRVVRIDIDHITGKMQR